MATPQTIHCRATSLVERPGKEKTCARKRRARSQQDERQQDERQQDQRQQDQSRESQNNGRSLGLPRPQDQPGHYREIGGSASDKWNQMVGGQISAVLPAREGDSDRQRDDRHEAGIMALVGIRPGDELEAMAAAQLIAVHSAAMESFRRAAVPGQHFEARHVFLGEAVRLTRGFARLLDSLGRFRIVALRREAAPPHDKTQRRVPAPPQADLADPEGGSRGRLRERGGDHG